jgi:SPRY domain
LRIGAYAIDDDPPIFNLVIASIVDKESFKKQCLQLDSATRDYLATRLDYYQVNVDISRQYQADSSLTVVDNYSNIAVKKNANTNCYTGLIWGASIHKYTVTVTKTKTHNMYINIGFASSKLFNVSKINNDSSGWYLFLKQGTLFSYTGDYGREYSSECKVGDTITCIYDALSSEISFEKNGVSLGVAFTNVKGEDIAPAVVLYHKNDSITLTSID